jgi:Holliday junction resolvase RusA-like endonuclease
MRFAFTVYGVPQPQGSARAYYVKKIKRAVITSDNEKLKPWRQEVALTAQAEMQKQKCRLIDRKRAVRLEALFVFQKPESARKLAIYKTTKPDFDKLIRAICDGLTGSVFTDDAQVCQCSISKIFGQPSRAEIVVITLD